MLPIHAVLDTAVMNPSKSSCSIPSTTWSMLSPVFLDSSSAGSQRIANLPYIGSVPSPSGWSQPVTEFSKSRLMPWGNFAVCHGIPISPQTRQVDHPYFANKRSRPFSSAHFLSTWGIFAKGSKRVSVIHNALFCWNTENASGTNEGCSSHALFDEYDFRGMY